MKNNFTNPLFIGKRLLLSVAMKIFIFLCCVALFSFSSRDSSSQDAEIKIESDMVLSIDQVFDLIKKQTTYTYIYKSDLFKDVSAVSLQKGMLKVSELLSKALPHDQFIYEPNKNGTILIKKSDISPIAGYYYLPRIISGSVIDKSTKEPLLGVNILFLAEDGKQVSGVTTDIEGKFKADIDERVVTLKISYVGYETVIIPVTTENSYTIELDESLAELDEVMISGFFEQKRASYTGAATTINAEQLMSISSTDIFKSLAAIDPAIVITESNTQGSNPNYIPEIIIRGTTSLNANNEFGINSPLIVIDGVESSLRALYDIDIFEIESITVLKDASATALYGEQASNGVILVKRKINIQSGVRISYNTTGRLDIPDLSEYNLMDARQKLELERLSGVYDDINGDLELEYNDRLAKVNSGINTDWIAKPVRTAFSQNHSLNISGRGSGMEYRLSGRFNNNQGVMKDDYRNIYGLAVYLSYNHNSKLIATFRGDFNQTAQQDSKYGSFNDYARANPYDAPYDENGALLRNLSHNINNPLYEASLASFSESKTKNFVANLNLRWNMKSGLFLTTQGNISNISTRSDVFISPDSYRYSNVINPASRGSYSVDASENLDYYLKSAINFNRNLDEEGSIVTLNLGGEVRSSSTDPYGFTATGYYNDKLTDPTFAAQFLENSSPRGERSESTGIAGFASANFLYKSRYFLDGSYRLSGSSKFGTDQRYAPFWSIGAGWNLHNESFLNKDWVDVLRLRTSFGRTGSINFASYQAITTYQYNSNLIHKYGYGTNPITLGNEDLKWETTETINIGITSTFLLNRFNFNFDIYNKRTFDMIVPIAMPPSTGVSTVQNNVGEQKNQGFEATLSGMIIKKRELNWRLNVGLQRNKTTLIDIGNALRNRNVINAGNTTAISPSRLFIEGASPSMIYTVRSAGIDPATGREIFIKNDGELTYVWNADDKVAVGDQTPEYRGNLSSSVNWKNFSLNVTASYSVGGYLYNATRVSRIEQIDPRYNADARAFTDRWKTPGDVVEYLSIVVNPNGIVNNYHSTRFVEKDNYLSISSITLGYEFSRNYLQSIGFDRLRVGVDVNDPVRFSTVKQERGTIYPFARGFTINLSATF